MAGKGVRRFYLDDPFWSFGIVTSKLSVFITEMSVSNLRNLLATLLPGCRVTNPGRFYVDKTVKKNFQVN